MGVGFFVSFGGKSSDSYVVLRGVPHVAWYLYGTYDTLEDCQTDTNFDGDLYFQVQSDCNSRQGSKLSQTEFSNPGGQMPLECLFIIPSRKCLNLKYEFQHQSHLLVHLKGIVDG